MECKDLVTEMLKEKKKYTASTGLKPYSVKMNPREAALFYDQPYFTENTVYADVIYGLVIIEDKSLKNKEYVFEQYKPSREEVQLLLKLAKIEAVNDSIKDRINNLRVEAERLEVGLMNCSKYMDAKLALKKERGY